MRKCGGVCDRVWGADEAGVRACSRGDGESQSQRFTVDAEMTTCPDEIDLGAAVLAVVPRICNCLVMPESFPHIRISLRNHGVAVLIEKLESRTWSICRCYRWMSSQ